MSTILYRIVNVPQHSGPRWALLEGNVATRDLTKDEICTLADHEVRWFFQRVDAEIAAKDEHPRDDAWLDANA